MLHIDRMNFCACEASKWGIRNVTDACSVPSIAVYAYFNLFCCREQIEDYFDFLLMTENEVSNFHLWKFAEIEPFCELLRWRIDINTRNNLDNSGSNETMEKVLAPIV